MAASSLTAQLAGAATTFGSFFGWWGRSLAAIVPKPIRRLPEYWRVHHFLDFRKDKILLIKSRGSTTRTLLETSPEESASAPGAPAKRPVVVRLAGDHVFARKTTLPLNASRDLRQIVVHEIERQTPFSADQIVFDCRIVQKDAARKQIVVEFVVAKRSLVEQILETAGHLGFRVARIGLIGDAAAGSAAIDLNRLDHRRRSGLAAYLNVFLAIAVLALGAIWLDRSYTDLAAESAALNIEVGKASAAIRRTDALQKDIARIGQQGGFLAQRRQETSTLDALRELTAMLPDDVWAFEFQLTGKESRISGYAPDASTLIAAFEQSRLFQNPRFRAPVTRAADNLDRFDLSFDLRAESRP